MLLGVELSKEFWVEAINLACYLINKSPSISIHCRILKEVLYGSLGNYTNLRMFLLSCLYLCK